MRAHFIKNYLVDAPRLNWAPREFRIVSQRRGHVLTFGPWVGEPELLLS
ncbi:MAG: hypothetical protein LW731_07165 [Oxalobacteraceae bacterium]|nr:hypothetical protein [Oxalobacteraceae bacterium]